MLRSRRAIRVLGISGMSPRLRLRGLLLVHRTGTDMFEGRSTSSGILPSGDTIQLSGDLT